MKSKARCLISLLAPLIDGVSRPGMQPNTAGSRNQAGCLDPETAKLPRVAETHETLGPFPVQSPCGASYRAATAAATVKERRAGTGNSTSETVRSGIGVPAS